MSRKLSGRQGYKKKYYLLNDLISFKNNSNNKITILKLNVQDQAGVNDLIYRALKLTVEAKHRWGNMEVVEMLQHCNATNKLIMQGIESNKIDTFRQKVIKTAFLNLPIKFPKNIKAPKKLKLITDKETPQNFDKERELYIELISQRPAHELPKKMYHPAFGNLNPKQWGILNWMHMDHHLRQFGV